MIPDQVILVNEADEQIGAMDKIEAHRGEGKLHRAASVFLFNDKGELLLQQRSKKKIVGALLWANTCCGNVRPGETYEQCAIRRLREELGITGLKLEQVHKFIYQVRCNEEFSEHELDMVFVGKYDGEVKPNSEEVADVKWIPWAEFIAMLTDKNPLLVPWNQIMHERNIFSFFPPLE